MKFFFDETLETEKLYQELVSSRIGKILGNGNLNEHVPLDEREEEILRYISFNFVGVGDKLVEGEKQLLFEDSAVYDQYKAGYCAKLAGFVAYNPNKRILKVLPVVHFSQYLALAILPVSVLSRNEFDVEAVGKMIKRKGVVAKVSDEAKARLLQAFSDGLGTVVLMASGRPALSRTSEKIFLYDADIHHMMHSEMKGLSYEEMNYFCRVDKNQAVGDHTEPTKAEVGIDLYGNEQDPQDRDEVTCIGEGLAKNENAQLLTTREGYLMFGVGGVLRVRELHVVDGDLDQNFISDDPNLDILITKNVRDKTRILVAGNVRILGNLDGGVVISGREVVIAGGILRNAYVEAKGGIETQFITQSTIISEKFINVRKYIISCKVFTNGLVDLLDKKTGRLTGTRLISGEGVNVTQLGSDGGVSTKIEVTSSSQQRINMQKRECYKALIETVENKLFSYKTMLGADYFSNPELYVQKLPEKRKERFFSSLQNFMKLKEEKKLFEKMIESTFVRQKEAEVKKKKKKKMLVKVNKTVYSETSIVIESCEMKINNLLSGNCRFYYSSDKRCVMKEVS